MRKIKIRLCFMVAAFVTAIFIIAGFVNVSGTAYAESGGESIGQGEISAAGGEGFIFYNEYAEEFVYTADISVDSGGQACGLVFGADEDNGNYYAAEADFSEDVIRLWHEEAGEVASVSYDFAGAVSCTMTVTVNYDAVKVAVNDDGTAALVCSSGDYSGGYTGFYACNAVAAINNVSLRHICGAIYESNGNVTLDFSGYTVTKVVNITDGSYRLASGEYSVTGGIITIYESYLSTLAESGDYDMRIVTEEGDFTVTVSTSFTGATVTASATNYTVGNAVVITVSGGNIIGVLVDGTALDSSAYTVEDGVITISADAVGNLADGSHTVTVLTDNGRPQTTFNLTEQIKSTSTDTSSSHFWLIIDLVIFGAFIVGYLLITIIKKKRNAKEAV